MRNLSLLACVMLAAPALAQSSKPVRDFPVVDVGGTAVETVVPDRADITLGVFAEKPTAAEATAALARQSTGLAQEIEAAGIARKDVKTASVDLSPVYSEAREPKTQIVRQALTGFRASTQLVVTTANVEQVGDLLAKLLSTHANQLEGVAFRVSDRAEREDALLGRAVANAQKRARLLAEGAAMKLGDLVEIDAGQSAPMAYASPKAARGMATEAAASVAVRPGEERLEAHVRTLWRLLPK
ncbi:SIMPL domain-containing protein [Methylosinus sp. Sm6]|nr:SIMPL domain-containing protein [Methylosinus sp. Sm6]